MLNVELMVCSERDEGDIVWIRTNNPRALISARKVGRREKKGEKNSLFSL